MRRKYEGRKRRVKIKRNRTRVEVKEMRDWEERKGR